MRKLLDAILVLVAINVLILVGAYGTGFSVDNKDVAQSLSKLISSYAEPNSNPQFLVRDENQCRYWGQGYCARAEAKRKAIQIAASYNPVLPEVLQASPTYKNYSEVRGALTAATNEYITFLNTNPANPDFVARSKIFEESAGVLVGQLVNYLYDMQSATIARQTAYTDKVLMVQYLVLMTVLLLLCIIRFRKGGGLVNG